MELILFGSSAGIDSVLDQELVGCEMQVGASLTDSCAARDTTQMCSKTLILCSLISTRSTHVSDAVSETHPADSKEISNRFCQLWWPVRLL